MTQANLQSTQLRENLELLLAIGKLEFHDKNLLSCGLTVHNERQRLLNENLKLLCVLEDNLCSDCKGE